MNERIRELMNEAMDYYSNGYVDCPELNPEKFAQLIVRECARLCSDPVVMLQHFGIDPKSE